VPNKLLGVVDGLCAFGSVHSSAFMEINELKFKTDQIVQHGVCIFVWDGYFVPSICAGASSLWIRALTLGLFYLNLKSFRLQKLA
jgi:hypothetical protein